MILQCRAVSKVVAVITHLHQCRLEMFETFVEQTQTLAFSEKIGTCLLGTAWAVVVEEELVAAALVLTRCS